MSNQQNQGQGKGSGSRRRHPKAWAPYNFVPMPQKPVYADLKAKDDEDNKIAQRHDHYTGHTGYFEVDLTTETPLFIRGMCTVLEKETGCEIRKKPEAFSLDGHLPVIPGSSLRGMLRTLVEIVTRSKMHFVSDNKLVYRAVFGNDSLAQDYRDMVAEQIGNKHFMYPSTKIQGGYLQRGQSKSGWVIDPAQPFQNETFVLVDTDSIRAARISMAHPQATYNVYVCPAARATYNSRSRQGLQLELAQTNQISQQPAPGLEEATLVISGAAPKRHWYAAIYAPSGNQANHIPISQEMWDDYKIDRDLHRGIETRKINEGDPLFYLMDNRGKLVFFGPTMFFRMPYRQSIHDLMDKELRQKDSGIDYSEAMFGYVSEQNETRKPSSYAGRVSVTDAKVSKKCDQYFYETIVPKILSSPKPTTFQHYLEQPDDWETPTHQLRHYGDETQIRGHKLYWRQMIEGLESVKDDDQSMDLDNRSQHTVMNPVCEKVKFQFRVYFENLSDIELGALIWVLTFGGDEQARHQLGMGKPFGLGVVKLEPNLFLTERRERYQKLFDENGQWFTAKEAVDKSKHQKYVAAFKKEMSKDGQKLFDDQERIQELMVLLRMQEPDNPKFQYMQIEPENDYQGRPVLPYPSDALK